MNEQNFEKKLKQSLHQSPTLIEENHFQHTLLLARQESFRRQTRKRISFSNFFIMQLKFMGQKVWSVQGIFLLIVYGILSRSYESINSPFFLTKLLLCVSVFVFMTALPFLYRSVRYQMQEIEAASRFSSVKLLIAKLMVIGMGDISVLILIFAASILKTSLQIGNTIFYLCFPFLFISGICLFLLGHSTPKQFFVGSMGICSLLVLVIFMIPGYSILSFVEIFSNYQGILYALLILFCIKQFHYILYDSTYTEKQVV